MGSPEDMTMATLIPYRQHDPEAVTMDKTGSTRAAARARLELAAMEGIVALHVVRPGAFLESKVDAPEDCYLRVGGLEDWFDKDNTPPPDDRLQEAVNTQPVVSMIHGFVEDFQKLARHWQED